MEYLELDPLFSAPFEDGDHLFIYRDLDRTVEHIEQSFPGEGEAYRRFIDQWSPFARTVKETFLRAPGPFELGKTFAFGSRLRWTGSARCSPS